MTVLYGVSLYCIVIGNTVTACLFCTLTLAVMLCMLFLSVMLINKLSIELVNEIDRKKIIDIPIEDIKKLGNICNKLDKYNVQYEIDYNSMIVIAYVSIGMYTRMSVSNNLEYGVHYHIIGTDKVLVKPK